jgi:hypothetical protein
LSGTILAGLERLSYGQSANVARRLLVFFTPNGTIHQYWRPSVTQNGFEFPVGSMLEPLTPHKNDLLVCDGIDFKATANHEPGMKAMLTGNGTLSHVGAGASIDQYLASVIGGGMPFSSLELGALTSAWGANSQTRMCYAAPGTYVPPDDDPASVHARLSEKLAPVSNAPSVSDLRRKKVLELVAQEIDALKPSIGGVEKQKLDAHLDALSNLQISLSQSGLCGSIDAIPPLDAQANDNFPAVAATQLDLLTTALACGMTRVASIQLSHTVGPPVFTWLGLTEGHHSLSHKGDEDVEGMLQYVAAERWFAGQFAALLDRLKATPDIEFGGTLFDTTLVVWAQEMGDGRMHDCISVPFVLAGAPNVLDAGKYVWFDHAPHQKLLVSICHAFGLQNMTFGDPSHGTGPLAGVLS